MYTPLNTARALAMLAMIAVVSSACSRNAAMTSPSTDRNLSAAGRTTAMPASADNPNGSAGEMPAFYDGDLFTVNMKQFPDGASEPIHAHDPSFNTIYASNDLDDPQDFVPVIDAIQGDGFNPVWEQVLIVFNPGFTPHQFFSDDEVEAAAEGANPEITLVDTEEFYRCSVVGPK